VGANSNQSYGKPAGTGFVNDGLYPQRQDYIDAGVSLIGVYDACQSQTCTLANGIENIEPLDFRANTTLPLGEVGKGTYDGLARWTTDETFAAQRIWSWQQFHWGRPTYYLYYTVSDAEDNYQGCLDGTGLYASSRGMKPVGDCIGLDEAAFQFSAAGDGTYLYPGLIADWGGTTDFVIETYVLKQLRNMIRDNTLLHIAWANKRDAGEEILSIVQRGLSSNVRHWVRDDPNTIRGMVGSINRLALSTESVNRKRHPSYPRAVSGQYRHP
jgi:hypothetical protein